MLIWPASALHLRRVFLMPVLRWVSFLLAVGCLVALFFTERGTGTVILAILFAILFTIFCATVGAFARTTDSEITHD